MKQSTGQLDKLIEEKVDEKIRKFSSSITEQIRTFLKENGDYSGDYLCQAQEFDMFCQEYRPINYENRKINLVYKNLIGGLELTIKKKMIDIATKDLLNKVALLS